MRGMGFGSREEPEFIRSRLMNQLQSSLNTAVADSIRKACTHWDYEVLHLENNYQNILEEHNGLKTENKNLANRVKALEAEVNANVALLREFQSGHLKTTGSRKLPPSSSAISTEFESLERRIKDTVFARLARLNIKDPYIAALLQHRPFTEAVKAIMVDEKEAQDAENVPLNLLEVVEEAEKKGLLMWIIQGVIHDVLHKKIMKIHMPGLNTNELQVVEKIFNVIALSEDGQGIKSAQEWRADTYKHLAYWAENADKLGKYIEASPEIGEIGQVFGDLIESTEEDITRILEPLCDESTEGENFSRLIVDIVDRAFQFSILIGSQVARYELHRNVDNTDDFKAVPDHLDESASAANSSNVSLFYAVPALVKTSSEDGEAYDPSELLVPGKIYVLFGYGDPIEEEQMQAPPDVPEKIPIQMASPVNGGDLENQDVDAITNVETSQGTVAGAPEETAVEPKGIVTDPSTKPSGADTLPNESNPNMTESTDQTPKNEPNGATATTTSNSSENDTSKETLDTPNRQLAPEVEGHPHRETSTKTDQVIIGQKNLELQPQATQKTLDELLETSLSGKHPLSSEKKFQNLEAHPTEIPASPSLPKPPSIPEQPVPLPVQEAPAAIPELQCPVPAPAETEAVPPPVRTQIQTQDSTTPASHTASAAAEVPVEETPHPQVPVETQREPLPEHSTSSISRNQELASQNEPEQLNPQLTNSNSEISLVQSTPRTLPPEPIELNSNSDSKTPILDTIQEGKGVGVETVG